MSKRIRSLFLALIFVVSLLPVTGAAPAGASPAFSDIPDNWATQALESAVENGLLQGEGDKILPDSPLTRAQMAAIITRAFGAVKEGDLSGYTDVNGTGWVAASMAKAYQMGVMQGYGGKMDPDSSILREQAFAVLARALKLKPASVLSKSFEDADQISDWAKGEVYALVNGGYIQGTSGKLNPKSQITRAEFAQVMYNLIQQYIGVPGEYTQVADGNIMINVPGVTLKNVTVTGDLILGDGVGDGEVILDQVTIQGNLIARGGGINSIILVGGGVEGSVVIAKVDGQIRVSVEGGANVQVIVVDDGKEDVIIEGTVGTVQVTAPEVPVVLQNASVNRMEVTAEGAQITVAETASVTHVTVAPSAAGSTFRVAGTVTKLETTAPETRVTGKGTVERVEVLAGATGSSIETPNTEIVVQLGVSGVTGGGGTPISGGSTVVNNQTGTGVTTPTASGGGGGSTPTIVPATEIQIDKQTMLLEIGAKETITATVLPSDATYKSVTWTTSDAAVATVVNGVVTAVGKGEAVITAKTAEGSFTATCTVTVVKDWLDFANTDWYDESAAEFTITTPEELAGLAALVNRAENPVDFAGKQIILGEDLDLLGLEWAPIGYLNDATEVVATGDQNEYQRATVFRGSFDGAGKTISNLKIHKGDDKAIGLFGVVSLGQDDEIKNVAFENVSIHGYTGVGVLAGMLRSGKTWVKGQTPPMAAQVSGIEVCNAVVSGLKYVGGVIGYSTASVADCSVSNAQVTANYEVGMAGKSGEAAGGIAGNLYDLYSITGCTVENATITSQTRAGGIAGSSRYSNDISYCQVKDSTIVLVESQDQEAPNEGYAGYLSGRAEPDVAGRSPANSVVNVKAVLYGTELTIGLFCMPVSKVSLSPALVMVGQTKALTATVEPIFVSNMRILWASDNEEVATIDANGNLTGVSVGTVTITATSAADPSKKASAAVTVIQDWSDLADAAWFDPSQSQFTIDTPEALAGLAALVNEGTDFNGKTVTLGAEMDLQDIQWVPIGTDSKKFKGTFDGNGKKISHLYLRSTSSHNGLFGNAVGGTLKNVLLEHVDIGAEIDSEKPYYVYTGAVAGAAQYVTDCTVTGNIRVVVDGNARYIGGILGQLYNGYLTGSTLKHTGSGKGLVSGKYDVGGLAGYVYYGTKISGSSVENMSINGRLGAGGVSGRIQNETKNSAYLLEEITIRNVNLGRVTEEVESYNVGGFLGYPYLGITVTIQNSALEDVTIESSHQNNGLFYGLHENSEEYGRVILDGVSFSGNCTTEAGGYHYLRSIAGVSSGLKTWVYDSIQAAIDAVKNLPTPASPTDYTISVMAGTYGEALEIVQQENKNLTLQARQNGDQYANVTLTGTIRIDGDGRFYGSESLTIKGFTFDFSQSDSTSIISAQKGELGSQKHNYAHHLTVADNVFIGNPSAEVVAVKTTTGATAGLRIANCAGLNLHSLGQLHVAGELDLVVENCVVAGGESGIHYYGSADAVITNLTVEATKYGVRAGQSSGEVNENITLTITSSNLRAEYPLWLRGDAPKTVTLIDTTLSPAVILNLAGSDITVMNHS